MIIVSSINISNRFAFVTHLSKIRLVLIPSLFFCLLDFVGHMSLFLMTSETDFCRLCKITTFFFCYCKAFASPCLVSSCDFAPS